MFAIYKAQNTSQANTYHERREKICEKNLESSANT